MNDNYIAASGGTIYAGLVAPSAVPSWVSAQAESTWGIVPLTNTISSIDANSDPSLNPNHPASAPWRASGGISAITFAWCGWHADTSENKLHSLFNGGHSDYGGNEHIVVDLNSDAPVYALLRPPSGSKNATYPTGFTTNDGLESSGVYADGLPRSIHTYNKNVFVPDIGLITAVQGNCYISAAGGTNKTIVTDPSTGAISYFGGEWLGGGGNSSGLGACYDPTRRCIWTKGVGTGRFFKRTVDNIASQAWISVGATSIEGSSESGMEYSPDDDVMLLIRSAKVYAVNPSNGAWFDITSGISGSLTGAAFSGKMQPRYIGNRRFAVWDNTTDTTKINILSWSGDPYVATNWSITQLPVAPANTVTPSGKTGNGTYGRFAYLPNFNIFTLINEVNQPLYFYKLAA